MMSFFFSFSPLIDDLLFSRPLFLPVGLLAACPTIALFLFTLCTICEALIALGFTPFLNGVLNVFLLIAVWGVFL
jgi:hypothetical protein